MIGRHERSIAEFVRAGRVLAGGVNSPVRAYKAVGGSPVFIKSAAGALVKDVDEREYVDYVQSWGALLYGHAHPHITKAVQNAAARGTSYGTPTRAESELAETVCALFPSIERLRLVSSGTEAAMSALRLARAHTGRNAFVKFAGCYHGHADAFLRSAGSGVLTHALADSPGVPDGATGDTIVLPYNDADAARDCFAHAGENIAAVIVEPYAANMGLVVPRHGYLQLLRELTKRAGALLIFDEVVTGFRVAPGGVQEREGLAADVTLLGKILGAGMPLAAFGGSVEVMSGLAPEGDVYQAGTLSGNPLATAAALACLQMLLHERPHERLEDLGQELESGLRDVFTSNGVPYRVHRAGSMLCVFFTDQDVVDLTTAKTSDAARYARFFHGMLERGIMLPPSQFETWFLSAAHTRSDVARTVEAANGALRESFVPA